MKIAQEECRRTYSILITYHSFTFSKDTNFQSDMTNSKILSEV